MGRHPEEKMFRLTARVPRGQDGFWKIIRDLDRKGPWSLDLVCGETNVRHRTTVKDFVNRLVKGKIAEIVGTGKKLENGTCENLYRLLKRPAATPSLRRDGTHLSTPAQQRLWTAIRTLRKFTLDELAYAAGDSTGPVSELTTRRYVVHLSSEYLISEGDRRYRLKPSMNTGPAAPKILRTHVVWDSNRNKPMGADIVDAEEVA
ncbi:hypothetical protein AFEL58S_01970 [Afipia felis]